MHPTTTPRSILCRSLHSPRCPWCRPTVLRFSSVIALLLALAMGNVVTAQNTPGSNKQPFAFGADQTIIDLNKLVWEPFKAEGVTPGPELAVLRGDAKGGALEVMVRLPANYTFPNHSHTSDELYVWLKGNFTYIAADGTATPLSGQSYISLPGGVPHALACGTEPCVFYVRYARPLDLHLHPMPQPKH
jgi:quercetin dioxygenase-like cupin family protein